MIKNVKSSTVLIPILILTLTVSVAGRAASDSQTQGDGEYAPIPSFVPTDEVIESRLGTLDFPDGIPTAETARILADEMLYVNAISAYNNTIQGASLWALRKGFADVGVDDNEFIIASEMMDGKALFLTANMDTFYFWGNINLKDGHIVGRNAFNVNRMGEICPESAICTHLPVRQHLSYFLWKLIV